MSIHILKTWPDPFHAILDGSKTHEIRKADRPFAVGDLLHIKEWDPTSEKYTGAELSVRVTYITWGREWGIPAGLCVMSITRALRCPQCGHDIGHLVSCGFHQPPAPGLAPGSERGALRCADCDETFSSWVSFGYHRENRHP
jgi:hypothetical protein